MQPRAEAMTGRMIHPMNKEWLFAYDPSPDEPVAYAAPACDDADWSPVGLPHTWQTYETTKQLHPFIQYPSERDSKFWWYGWGAYRKRFTLSVALQGKRAFLEFDGVQKYARIYLNGRFAGEHKGGYTSFSIDVTDLAAFGSENVLAVNVSNRRNDPFGGIPPMTAGNFNVYGGIYRDVRLVLTHPLHIPFQGSAEHEGGTFVTTPLVSRERAQAHIATHVRNDGDVAQACLLRTVIRDREGAAIAELCDNAVIAPRTLHTFRQLSATIASPQLWSPVHPYVYRVESLVYADDGLADHYESPLGFRWFRWDYEEKRLYLNGERLHLHGTNRHQEYPWLGDAIPRWMHEADLADIKFNLGHNFLRTCHYTQDKRVYELCDEWGLLVAEEAPNIKNIAFDDEIQRQHVIEMIRRDRNHPSIIMWSMGNETNHAADGQWARAEDPTRIVHFRHVTGRGADEPHNHEQMEMENLLRCTIRGWYNGDVKPLAPANGQHAGHERWQHDQALVAESSLRGRIDTNGAMWIYADHGADREYVDSPLLHVNPKGWVDAYRIPKLMYYLWQANWSAKPMVYIHPYDWHPRYIGTKREIVVNSNCREVTLYVNDRAIGTLHPGRDNDHTVRFGDVTVVPDGRLRAVAVRGGETVTAECFMTGEPVALYATASHRVLPADRSGIAVIRVEVRDANGRPVLGACPALAFDVDGPGRLIGPDRYDSDRDRHESMEGAMYIDAPVAVPIRTTDEAGTIRFTAESPGLISCSVEIRSESVALGHAAFGIAESAAAGSGLALANLRDREARAANEPLPNAIADTVDDIAFDPDDASAFEEKMRQYMLARNPAVDPRCPAFTRLLAVFCAHLTRDRGKLVADDYNFNARKYNDCCALFDLLERAALPPETVQGERERYAEMIITLGRELDLETEKRNIMRIELNY